MIKSPLSRFGSRRAAFTGFAGAAVAIAVASVAYGCTVISGFTWYNDGTFEKSGSSGTVITAFATAARPNQQFVLSSGFSEGDPAHEEHGCMFSDVAVNPTVRTSNSSGFIGFTTGPVNRGPGEWQICFRQTNGATATLPVLFTVVGG